MKRQQFSSYATHIFDCDGVVLNSNKLKTDAFFQAALPYGEAAAQAMVNYHVANGGISRYKKFAYFLEDIIAPTQAGPDLEALLNTYASHVREGLLNCPIAPGLEALRQKVPDARWLIVSGGDQAELREVFAQRNLAEFFNASIFGSPDTKDEILERELANGNITQPALFLGDSKYDYQAASSAGLDFLFVSGWSEVEDWHAWTTAENINGCRNIHDLLQQ
ncbi:HAD family hydrolase [Halomonas glaciei]|uniref:phosphoglycolate phosphatase n=1 Tax=Vreelandella glaciei TaxID=186761 RepID=A0A7Z0RYP2_9GAMM|nr:HAD family hydrolase [Halomonas glaciei]NYS78420.1 HAD family hydrolase [Halomonas glaciei]